jgi:hypothetical protein
MTHAIACALCGDTAGHRLVGRTGCACVTCLGEAVKQAICGQAHHPPTVTASDRCLLCGVAIVCGNLVAVRAPYRLCAACLRDVAQVALSDGDAGMRQVDF